MNITLLDFAASAAISATPLSLAIFTPPITSTSSPPGQPFSPVLQMR